MPELPEVETVRRGLTAALPGCEIIKVALHREGLRQPFTPGMAAWLKGKSFTSIERRSKYLIFRFGEEKLLLCHLGMSGAFLVQKEGEHSARKHDHAVFTLDNGTELIYHDPRRFGLILLVEEDALDKHPLMRDLGPEPLTEDFSAAYLKDALLQRKGPVKPALMDAKLVVGLGNIYAAEALYRTGLHPTLPAPQAAKKTAALIPAIRAVLEEAIASGGSTLRDYTNATGQGGHFQHRFDVYGREGKPCRVCNTAIKRITQAGRSSFFCPRCQRLPRRKA